MISRAVKSALYDAQVTKPIAEGQLDFQSWARLPREKSNSHIAGGSRPSTERRRP